MDKQFKIVEYKIPKVMMDFDAVVGDQQITVGTIFTIMVPKDLSDKTATAVIRAEFKNNDKKTLLCVTIKGFIEFYDIKMSVEEREELITHDVVPIIYEKLRVFIEQLFENAQIEFLNLPPYDEIRK